MLPKTAVDEFKNLYLQNYGLSLTNEQAIEYGDRLLGIVRAVYRDNLPEIKTIDSKKGWVDD